jgi:uncharacterized membrane protein
MGAHARVGERRWWTPVRVLLVFVFFTSALGIVTKNHCRETGWTAPGHFVHACYTDIVPLYYGRGLAEGDIPYVDQPEDQQVEYPVLTGLVMWATAQAVPEDVPEKQSRWYFDLNVLALAMCAAVAVVATARTAGRRPWDAAMFALAPGLALAGTINWDLYAVALLAGAMLAWKRKKPVPAGVLLGLGAAAKFYPLFVLGPLLLLCWRAGKMRTFATTLAAAVGAWSAVNLPVMLADFDGWSRFYALSSDRGAGFSSIWFVLDQQGVGVGSERLNLVAGGLFLALCIGIAWLALTARRRPRLAQLAFLTVAAFLLTNKVYSPQYVLWLLPLAVLARPRWRDFLIWQAGEVVHYFGIWLLLAGYPPGNVNRALGDDGYGWTVLAHLVGTLWLVAMVVRDIRAPEHDVVRADGVDDPGGGVLDGAPDARRVRQLEPA